MNDDQIDTELKCMICLQPFVNPKVGVQCGHTLCDMCITNWYKNDSSCPTCRQTTTFMPLTARVVLSQLNRLLVRCQQCDESNIERGNFADHIQYRCRQTILKCEAADLKCSWTGNREQRVQHSAICPLLQIRPVVEELKQELSVQAYQLQTFMDEVREQLSYLQQQHIRTARVDNESHTKTYENNSEKERFGKINNDLRHTWSMTSCRNSINCRFCENDSQQFFTCLVCLRSSAYEHICAHDYNGSKDDVICMLCVKKYGNQMHFFV